MAVKKKKAAGEQVRCFAAYSTEELGVEEFMMWFGAAGRRLVHDNRAGVAQPGGCEPGRAGRRSRCRV